MKDKIMKVKCLADLMDIENEVIEPFRDKFYNDLLEDKEIEKHLCEVLKTDKVSLQNVLMINGNPPLDDFNPDER